MKKLLSMLLMCVAAFGFVGCNNEEEPAPPYVGSWTRTYDATESYNNGGGTYIMTYKERLNIYDDKTASLTVEKYANSNYRGSDTEDYGFVILREHNHYGTGLLVVNYRTGVSYKFNYKVNTNTLTLTPSIGKAVSYIRVTK